MVEILLRCLISGGYTLEILEYINQYKPKYILKIAKTSWKPIFQLPIWQGLCECRGGYKLSYIYIYAM